MNNDNLIIPTPTGERSTSSRHIKVFNFSENFLVLYRMTFIYDSAQIYSNTFKMYYILAQ